MAGLDQTIRLTREIVTPWIGACVNKVTSLDVVTDGYVGRIRNISQRDMIDVLKN